MDFHLYNLTLLKIAFEPISHFSFQIQKTFKKNRIITVKKEINTLFQNE